MRNFTLYRRDVGWQKWKVRYQKQSITQEWYWFGRNFFTRRGAERWIAANTWQPVGEDYKGKRRK